ncbi:hypothetical protein KIMH_06310 [Bombiscardovia apis]|uniref:Uncharacterized protein n=1 Tax=Bombiscardovia apis TaxID=2932182 RepID=A0ABN6SIN9_9BIFI|nr:hypothetical protein [Bombiscardovia apis]BDR54520.1 hypothetical protein KIMH_06310 [Bombiscardovia apis]
MTMNKLLFDFYQTDKPLLGKLVYRESEYSLDFIECSDDNLARLSGDGGRTSLTVHTLQIEIGINTGKLLYPWGLFPLIHAIDKPLTIPDSYYGELSVNTAKNKLISGVSIEFPDSENWELCKDPSSGWVFVGNPSITQYSCSIEFANNVIASIENDCIVAFWMRPVIEI